MDRNVDVVILVGGLAGLSLARQLGLTCSKSILLLEKCTQIPPVRKKVGEATVQLSGYYFSKVLDLEEHLLRKHLMKYNFALLLEDRRILQQVARRLQPILHSRPVEHRQLPTGSQELAARASGLGQTKHPELRIGPCRSAGSTAGKSGARRYPSSRRETRSGLSKSTMNRTGPPEETVANKSGRGWY
jgi:hypothetical protein